MDSPLEGKRILIVPDVKGWTFDFNFQSIARGIQAYVPSVRFDFEYGKRLRRGKYDIALMSYFRQRSQIVDDPKLWCSGVSSWGWKGNGHCDGEFPPPREITKQVSAFKACYVANRRLHAHFSHLPRCFYVPFGVDTDTFYPDESQRDPSNTNLIVGWCGHPGRIKRLEVIEQAVAAVDGVQLSTRKYGTDSYTSDRNEMRRFYNRLDAYIVASRAEGEPKTAKEAASCGVPLIGTNVGCMDTLISEGISGYFFDGTVNDLVEKLTYLRDNRDQLVSMRKRVVARSQQYCIKFVSLRWMRFFEESLDA
jgi:glycosyltransferase involved in cell wall biosynthesis